MNRTETSIVMVKNCKSVLNCGLYKVDLIQ